MRIETTSCPDCGTIIAANVLESERTLKCPGLGCGRVHRFTDLSADVQRHYEANHDRYQME
ncbi:hypothetical protein [Haloprofundus halophilus]|uniref:hypothetical protein n=1 Tax=Haloprofundus halophilus TaxID=2283527 RepID=UPI000E44FD55|nr:hypothetical protein [Haloprofundus halophilus]